MNEAIENRVRKILSEQNFAILATLSGDRPYTNIVAFHCSGDLKTLLFITPEATAKYERIRDNPNLSLFIDDRSNRGTDISESTGITIIGKSCSINEDLGKKLIEGYISKHPYLEEFALSSDSAPVFVKAIRYHIVYKFQDLVVLDFEKENG